MKKVLALISICSFQVLMLQTLNAQQTLYVAANSGLTLRRTASTSGEKLDLLPWGTAVTARHIEYGAERTWAEVQVNGKTGYAALDYLTPIKLPTQPQELEAWVKSLPGAVERKRDFNAFDPNDPTAGAFTQDVITDCGVYYSTYSEVGTYTTTLFIPLVSMEIAKFIIGHLTPMQAYQGTPNEKYTTLPGVKGVYYIFSEQ
jgi:Bacterial SH3 domain